MSDSELPAALNVPYTFVSALFYGLYLSTVFHCLRWLVFADEGRKTRRKINWAMVSITIVLWALSTTSRALDLRSSMIVVENQTTPAVDPLQSATMLLWMDVLSCTNAAVSTLLADAVLIYRCWIIYAKSHWVVALPILLWLGGLVLTVLQAYSELAPSPSILKTWKLVNTAVRPGTIMMPFWALTIVLNSYVTFMIVRRIYLVARVSKASVAKPAIHQLQFVMRILIESGSLYLAVAIAQFISWWTPNGYAIFIISSINMSMTGIAFNLILIRAARHRVEERQKEVDVAPELSNIQFCAHGPKSSVGQFGASTRIFFLPTRRAESNVGDTPSTMSAV
ncbi:hypothetical protein BJ912DRAFT_1146192 [Pholiota molesta]|nr:hypothetical protein BJ912DRAFT_1146192 [Pholiota molesta]